jgi:hypothetical protein
MKFTIEPAPIAAAVRHLNSVIERRNTIPMLSCIMIEASAADGVTLTATDLDTEARVTLAANVETDGAILLDGWALDSMLKPTAKSKYDYISFDGGVSTVRINYGRADYRMPIVAGCEDFPRVKVGEMELVEMSDVAALDCPIEGFDVIGNAAKLFPKLCKVKKGETPPPVEIETYSDGGSTVRMVAKVGGWTITAKCGEAGYVYKPQRAPKFEHRYSDGGADDVISYMTDLAKGRGLALFNLYTSPYEGAPCRLPVALARNGGDVQGATFGAIEEAAYRAGDNYYHDWTLEEQVWRALDWHWSGGGAVTYEDFFKGGENRKREASAPAQYAPGSFSVVMPRENAAMGALVTLSTMGDDGTWSDWRSVATDSAGKLDWDSLPAIADLFAAPPLLTSAAAVDVLPETPIEAVETAELAEAPNGAATAESPCAAPALPNSGIPDPTVAALVARIEALERGQTVRAALIAAAANDVAPVMKRTEREERAIKRAWRIRCEARARRDLDVRALEAANVAYRELQAESGKNYERARAAELDAAQWREGFQAATDAAAANRRNLHSIGEQLQGAQRRADRLARVAVDQRKRVARLQSDLAGAKAETRAMARRADDARARYAVAHPSPTPPPPTDTVMAVAFATAR